MSFFMAENLICPGRPIVCRQLRMASSLTGRIGGRLYRGTAAGARSRGGELALSMVAWAMADFQLARINYSIIKVVANARQTLTVRPVLGP
jgi:hypothetical protein